MEISRQSTPQSVVRPLDFFKERPNVRKHYCQESLRELNASIVKHGQLQEVIALISGLLISGYRRLYAARLGGIPTLRAFLIEDELEAGRIHVMQGVENIQRENLSEVEIWEMLVEHKRLFLTQMNKDIAAEYHKDPVWATRYLSPSKCIPAWQEAFRAGRVGISDMCTVSKASEQQQHELLRMKLDEGATRDQLERKTRKARPQAGESVRTSRLEVPLPSGRKVIISGKKLSQSDVVETLTECLDAAKKAEKEKLDARTWQSVMRDRAKAVANA
jgi:ParB family transcriptional regulator, chromosome partitioning protein